MTRGSSLVGSVHAQGAHQRQELGDTQQLEESYAEAPPDMDTAGQHSILSIDQNHRQGPQGGEGLKAGKEAQDVSKSIRWAHRALWIDLSIYVVFLVSFMLATLVPFTSIAWDGHMFISIYTKYASQLEWPDPSNTFQDIHSVADFWSWWNGPMRSVLLGLNPFSLADDDFRPDHVEGHILSNVVVGTVRLRQQRVKLECEEDNALGLKQSDILCYHPDLRAYRAETDWAWPRFLATAGDNSFFAPVLTPQVQEENEDPSDTGKTPFAPFAGAGTVQGPPLGNSGPPMPTTSQAAPDTTSPPPSDDSSPNGGVTNSTDASVDTGATSPVVAPPADGTVPTQAPGAVVEAPAPAPGAETPFGVETPSGAETPASAPAAVPGVDPDLGIPVGAPPPAAALPPSPVEAPAAVAPAGLLPVDPDATPPAALPTVPETAEGPEGPVDPVVDPPEDIVPPEPADAEAGTTASEDGLGAFADLLPPPEIGTAATTAGASELTVEDLDIEGDVAEGPAGAKRKLLSPPRQGGHPHRNLGVLNQIPAGTPLSMAQVRQLLQDQAREATAGTDLGDLDDPEALADAAKKTPTTTEDGCPIANKAWRFGGSVPNRTCEQINAEKQWLETFTPAFKYRSHANLSAARYMSKTSTFLFDGSGYAHDFDVKNLEAFDNVTQLLQDFAWIDAGTRLIMLELSLYSPATDLVTSAFFMVEVQGSGYAQSRVGYEAFRLHYYKTNALRWGRLAVELLFVILSATSFASDLSPVIFRRNAFVKQDQHWARNPFFYMSVLMMGTTLAGVGLRIHNVVELSKFDPAQIAPGSDPFGSHFAQLQGPASRVRVERSLMALLSFCVWLRMFKYTRRVPVFGTIGRTMTRAFPAIVVFIAMSAVVFVGFAQSFFLGFYVSNEGFQTLQEALVSMVRFTSGDVDYDALKRTNTVLAPTLYCLALFVLGFVWTSLLLAIVINAYYDEVNDEDSFEFDKEFKDFRADNPLLRQHKEWDNDAMTGENGSTILTPEYYNRFVVNTLSKFDPNVPMISMTMAEFLQAARSNTNDAWAQGETQPLRRSGHDVHAAPPIADEDRPTFNPDDVEEHNHRHRGKASHEHVNHKIETDSSYIIVRFGSLKGPRKARDAHALYFPINMDEHRCRAWWKMHKHHLRVGDAVVRYIQKAPQKLRPQQLGHLLVNTAKAPVVGLAGAGNALLRSNTKGSRSSSGHGHHEGQHVASHNSGKGSLFQLPSFNGGNLGARYDTGSHYGGSAANSPSTSRDLEGGSHTNGSLVSRILGIRSLKKSGTMNSATTERSADDANEDFDQPVIPKRAGARAYSRSSSRNSDGRPPLGPQHTPPAGAPAPDIYAAAYARAGVPVDHAPMQPRSPAAPSPSAHTPPAPSPHTAMRAPDYFAPAPQAEPAAAAPLVPGGDGAGVPAGNDLSMDLLSGPAHAGIMSCIPEVTEPLTAQFTGGLATEGSGLHHRASSGTGMHRASSSADVMSPMGPPADTTIDTLPPDQKAAGTFPPVLKQDAPAVEEPHPNVGIPLSRRPSAGVPNAKGRKRH